MRRAFFCLSVMLCFAALAVSAGCGKESVRGYTGEQLTSISIYWQEPADFYAPDGVAQPRDSLPDTKSDSTNSFPFL